MRSNRPNRSWSQDKTTWNSPLLGILPHAEKTRPARGVITGIFEISSERLAEIAAEVRRAGKGTYHFEADLSDGGGQVVARVSKEVYVRFKPADSKP